MMAPFVERQFGGELYGYMKRIKRAFDPENRINPGVLISNDTMAHMNNIKFNPQIEQIADNCVECGYCEPICPSKDLTTTPRQRIVIRRAIESARSSGERETLKELLDDSTYEVTESCATDGLCASSCPLGINTGALVKGLRADTSLAGQKRIWDFAAHHWSKSLDSVGALLTFSSRAPRLLIKWPNSLLRALFGSDAIPLWSNDLPRGGRKRQRTSSSSPDFVLFTSCLDSMFASETATSFRSLALKANLSFTTPLGIEELCCGTPWKSKGYLSGYETMVKRTYEALLAASDQGRLHIVCENSSCSEGLIEALGERSGHRLKIIDAVDFASEYLLPKLKVTAKLNSVALHPTCSSSKLGSNENLQFLAHAISNEVTIPFDWGCCAFAGDRGLLHPELTKSATAPETASLAGIKYEAYLSTNLTCEIGMSRATGENYEHILCQLDRLTVALT
jgi:D-lactate dehydrogenase